MFSLVLAAGLLAASASAQRPSNTSVCDYYTTALLKDNNATNQETLITLLVNTAVIGNSTPTTANIKVPGILAVNQTYNGTAVNLLPYFDGSLKSSNRGGEDGVSINFLDDGAAVPIAKGKPADGESSNQYKLMTHLYAYFGILLGCSKYSQPGLPAYNGAISMYKVHKFMALDPYDFGFFVQQVALSAASYGVALADLEIVGDQLYEAFGYRCSALNTFVPDSQPALQSICITDDCLIEGAQAQWIGDCYWHASPVCYECGDGYKLEEEWSRHDEDSQWKLGGDHCIGGSLLPAVSAQLLSTSTRGTSISSALLAHRAEIAVAGSTYRCFDLPSSVCVLPRFSAPFTSLIPAATV
ncbi:hypothetical protein LTR53_007318 [Teratosphaeriaceae sp. CCFEE 6253]|nr:hypothetical protein LTR53_007318 [Teratosphaeriaceae sp. CCFEE 6253]